MAKFVPRERKHKVRKSLEQHNGYVKENDGAGRDSNAMEILPNHEKDHRKQEIRATLQAQQPKMSAKKQKRLDKYIDKKLQKEENLAFIKKLASTKVDTSLMRSSRNLGVNKSQREVLAQALNESKEGINIDSNRKLLYNDRGEEDDVFESSNDTGLSISQAQEHTVTETSSLGSGLKRPLDADQTGNPIITKRQRRYPIKSLMNPQGELPWDGFSSEEDPEGVQLQAPTVCSTGSQTDSEGSDSVESQGSEEEEQSAFSESGIELDEDERQEHKARSSAFKAWATHQFNEALGFKPSTTNTAIPEATKTSGERDPGKTPIQPRPPEHDPLPPEFQSIGPAVDRKAFHVTIDRSSDVQEARMKLPVVAEEQRIMEAIHNNSFVVICGSTGSGKTTQVPQFLYESGYGSPEGPNPGLIGVTQPRRVAAISTAARLGDELGSARDKVSYQVRFESSITKKMAIKFMTDGILVREIAMDFALLKYSVIIIDEAHERSVNTDILIGMLSRIVDLRASMSTHDKKVTPLKLVIMSATLRISDFLDNRTLFRRGPPPLVEVEGRQYPVTTHFAKRTQRNYIEEVYDKVCKGHRKLPPGGMLVFLTGKDDIQVLEKRLRETLMHTQGPYISTQKVRIAAKEAPLEPEDIEIGGAVHAFDDLDEDDEAEDDLFDHEVISEPGINDSMATTSHVHVLPLHAQLEAKDQLRVFKSPPDNSRLIVLATNVAETSLTIPGIRYVFDTGRAKEKKYDRMTGVQSFEVGWISKDNAEQRAGRAGRTSPGHCYRLYSSAVYQRDFQQHAKPEILKMPIEGIVLQLKSMDLQHVVNFPFPTPPDRQSLAKAEKLLGHLGAISAGGRITDIGRDLSHYPLSPRFSKMLTIGHQHDCMPYVTALVAALVTPNLFIPENSLPLAAPVGLDIYTNEDRQAEEARTKLRSAYNHAHFRFSQHSRTSDALKALTALCAFETARGKDDFCKEMFLSPKSLHEASNLRNQLAIIVQNKNADLLPLQAISKLSPPSKIQLSALQQMTAAAFIDQIAILHSAHPSPPELPRQPTRAIDVPYLPLFPISPIRKADMDIIDHAIFIHPSSVLAHLSVKDLPTYIVYSHLQRGSAPTIDGNKRPKTRMHALGSVSGKQIAALARGTPLLEYGKPIGKIEEMEGRRRLCWAVPALVGEKGTMGWPLPAVKVVQARDKKGAWEVEKIIG